MSPRFMHPPDMPQSSPILDEALRRRQVFTAGQGMGQKAALLLVICLVSLLDANYGLLLKLLPIPIYTLGLILYMVEMTIFAFSLTNLIGICWRMVSTVYTSPLPLSDYQYRLLRLHPDTPGFTRSPIKEEKYPNPFSPLPGSLIHGHGGQPSSPAQSVTPVNTSYNSWMSSSTPGSGVVTPSSGVPGTPGSAGQSGGNSPLNTSNNLRRDHFAGYESPITDELQLSEYLSDYSAWESSYLASPDRLDDSGSVSSQSLLYWRGGSKPDPSQLRRSVYQLSTPPSKSASNTTDSPADKAKSEILSERLGVDPMQLVAWNENLRIWITQTILKPLVSEIDTINSYMPKHGVSDCKIGESPLDRLRKVSLLPQVAVQLPTLAAVLPFLEISQDQEYLVGRLKELAKTGALSLYRWNSGGKCRGQNWTDKMMTDSELLMHLVAVYLDSRLVASSTTRLQTNNEAMPFTQSHFFKFGEKVDKPDASFLGIVQTKNRPPHYVLQFGDKQLDVGGGRNNLIHTILLFLHQVKEERGGMIGRVNLGLSGLNILWVLD